MRFGNRNPKKGVDMRRARRAVVNGVGRKVRWAKTWARRQEESQGLYHHKLL